MLQDEKRLAREVKLLLLGAGASGKSTVLKQMRLVHSKPFTPDEVEDFRWAAVALGHDADVRRKIVFSNLVTGMRLIIDTMDELHMSVSDENRQYVGLVDMEPPINTGEPFPMEYKPALQALWDDEGVQKCWSRAYEYALQENMP